MTPEVLAVLAAEAREELARDSHGDRCFGGAKSYAAGFVYFRAMRAGRIIAEDVRAKSMAAIREIVSAMSSSAAVVQVSST